ncbi:MAG: B12-binding domain-containing radical SAM protein [Deltaproteobacteria bacterium]|nr:B12-binding domain-containing radical SAM protein [Deltaproteobacteria bacterium]
MRTDLVLIKPSNQKELYGTLSEASLTAIEPPLWACLIAAFIRKIGLTVEIIDGEAEGLTPAEIAVRIEELNPLLAAIVTSGTNPSASTMNMCGVRLVLAEMERRGMTEVKTLVSGLHPSALPKRTMEEERCDFLSEGEGFHTIAGLLTALKKGPKKKEFDIPGLWYRNNGKIIANPRAPLIGSLDKELPHASWDLLPMDRYRAHNWHCFGEKGRKRQPYGVIYTSLGCPFRCHFCCVNALFGTPGIRLRSPRNVVDEIGMLVRDYGVRNIKVLDEMFVLNHTHVLDICDLIIERGYCLNIWAYARINTVDEKLLSRLKKAGVNWLAYGIESGSDRILKSVAKGITVEKTRDVVRMTKEAGINVMGNYILGLPEDDLESMGETMELAAELNCEFVNIYCATAYPGSPLYEQALKEGWKLPERWADYSPYSYGHLPLPTKYLSAADVLKFRDESYTRYSSGERYQRMIREKFGGEVLDAIKNGLTKKLRRRHLEEITGQARGHWTG